MLSRLSSSKYRHVLPPDVLSWQELYEIFVQEGLVNEPEVCYQYEIKEQRSGFILEAYTYQMAYIEKKVSEEVVSGHLSLNKDDWHLIYDALLSCPKDLPVDLLEKVKKIRSLACR